MTGRPHNTYVTRWTVTGDHRRYDWQAFCHGCRWHGDVTSYEPLAREQARQHSREGERE